MLQVSEEACLSKLSLIPGFVCLFCGLGLQEDSPGERGRAEILDVWQTIPSFRI